MTNEKCPSCPNLGPLETVTFRNGADPVRQCGACAAQAVELLGGVRAPTRGLEKLRAALKILEDDEDVGALLADIDLDIGPEYGLAVQNLASLVDGIKEAME